VTSTARSISGKAEASLDRKEPAALSFDREALRRLLIERAFLQSSHHQPLLDRHGRTIPWMYYGGELCLSADGLKLMASAVADLLKSFSATQIATYGQSAVPILAACVAQGSGRFSGLVIRKERKDYGACRQIDGPLDRARRVVVIDESISSGMSAYHAIAALEREGLAVEGIICVVEFTGHGAAEWLRSYGYRVETVFNVWSDLERAPTPRKAHEPFSLGDWSVEALPPTLTPAEAARRTAEIYCQTGFAPRPPERFDRDYDTDGGLFVSIRRRADDHRVAREGFWLNELESPNAQRAVVEATVKALQEAERVEPLDLSSLKFAVAMIGRMEPIGPAQIDSDMHALVVRGRGPLDRISFALPNSPQHADAIEQYHYAHTVSGSFSRYEPHDLYRQRVERSVEPGEAWPDAGAPRLPSDWTEPTFVAAVERCVRDFLERAAGHSDPPTTPIPEPPEPIFGVGVTLYRNGIAGCSISMATDLEAGLGEALAAAFADERYSINREQAIANSCTVVVSILTRRRLLGRISPERVRLFYRLGVDTLKASTADRSGFVLAHFPIHQSVSPEQYRDQVARKASITVDAAEWAAFETIGILVRPGLVAPLDLGFPKQQPSPENRNHWLELAHRVAGFVLAQRQENGWPAYLANPWDGSRTASGTATRVLLALNGLLELGAIADDPLRFDAESMVEMLIERHRGSGTGDLLWDSGSDAQLLQCLALMRGRERHRVLAQQLVSRLRRLVRTDGAIYAGASRITADLDLLSGSVLLALASSDWVQGALDDVDLRLIFQFYHRRFDLMQPWSMVWWHGRAWNRLADCSPEFGRFAEELVDWAIERQSNVTGAFVIHSMEPARISFLSACVLEAVGDVWLRAARSGDVERAQRYAEAWTRGSKFIERLVLSEDDCYFAVDAASLIGGVRATLASSELRIDYAGHVLLSLAKGLRAEALDPRAQNQK
jgi:orotate phosphoribosyltransferase/AMMECR1 domain-containing protein